MKKTILFPVLLLSLCFTFISCQKSDPVIEIGEEQFQTNGILNAKIIDHLRTSNEGVLYETPPAGYKFSQEGKLKYTSAYLFKAKDGRLAEYYGFKNENDYKQQMASTRGPVNRKGNAGTGGPCPNTGINCGWDPNAPNTGGVGNWYFPYSKL